MKNVYAMFVKRALYTWRRPLVTVLQATTPFGVAMLVLYTWDQASAYASTPFVFDLSKHGKSVVLYGARTDNVSDRTTRNLADTYIGQFDRSTHSLFNVNEIIGVNRHVHDYLTDEGGIDRYEYVYHYMAAAQFDNALDGGRTCAALFNYEAYHTAASSLVIFLLYVCAILPTIYLTSLVFSSPAKCLGWMTVYTFMTGELSDA